MKRTTLLIITALMAVCARAQYKSVMTVGAADADEPYQMAFNLTTVCKSLGVERDTLGHILEVWLDPNRTWVWDKEYMEYEDLTLMYLLSADGDKSVSGSHSRFTLNADGTPWSGSDDKPFSLGDWQLQVTVEPKQNQLYFNLTLMPDVIHHCLAVKAGDTCHAVLGLEYEGREVTFDLTIHIVEGNANSSVSLDSFEKVGEECVALKYQQGKPCYAQLDLVAIASHFGGDVEGGNLRLYVGQEGNPGMLSERTAYSEVPMVNCTEDFIECADIDTLPRISLRYYPLPQQIYVVPYPDAFALGEHATGSVYLVADGKYYELLLDAQFGDSEQEAKNMAVVEAAAQCGTFARSLTLSPSGSYLSMGDTIATASFNLAVLARALGTDSKSLTSALEAWMRYQVRPDGTEMIYNLSDHASTDYGVTCGSYAMKKDGRVARTDDERQWYSRMELDRVLGELQFHLYQIPKMLQDGNVCNTKLGLYYEGRMVTLDLTLNIRKGKLGELVALNSMKKVGEETISGQLDYTNGLYRKLNLTEIASHFSSGIEGKSLKLYVMADPERQMLTDRYTYESAPRAMLTIECTTQTDFRTLDYFWVSYSPYPETLLIGAPTDAFHGGQHSSGSIFFADGNEYYEMVLDIQFGNEYDERESLDVVSTELLNVQLMATDSYYTYYDKESGSHALVSTPINEAELAEILGTETPVLYAEQLEADGRVTLTSRYNCAPGQGFWLTPHEGQAYRTAPDEIERLGVYFADGSLRWYEAVYPPMKVGEHYRLNLYLADPESGRAVKYEIEVEIVNEIETPSIAYVHRLPADLTRNANGVEAIHNAQFTMHNVGNAIYNLQGRKINLPQPLQRRGTQGLMPRGVYIVNGKKVLIK